MTDTLQIDHELLEQLQQDPRYAYAIEEDKPSLFHELMTGVGKWLDNNIEGNIDFYRPVFYGICTVAVIILVWWLWQSGMLRRLFGMESQTAETSMEEAEANIHGVDFDREIARAREAGDYTRASRLVYLQTLKRLSDAGRIDWQPQKTPSQYAFEVNTGEFLQLTNHFMRIRYGGFEADEQLFLTMTALQDATQKGGEA